MSREIERAINDWAKLDERTLNLITLATEDLYNGPVDHERADALVGTPWPGFSKVCNAISKAIDALPTTELWISHDACICESEPRWFDPDAPDDEDPGEWPEDYTIYDRKAIVRALVGRELAQYV